MAKLRIMESCDSGRLLRKLEELEQFDVMVLGCGLGQSQSAMDFIRGLLLKQPKEHPPLVLDADALNTLAKTPDWWRQLADNVILTPHPGEMSRLSRVSIEEVQSNRIGIAREKAQEWQKTVVLKGAYTVVATPDGPTRVSPIANPGLASAGTGDVLTGVIAGLMAPGPGPVPGSQLRRLSARASWRDGPGQAGQ